MGCGEPISRVTQLMLTTNKQELILLQGCEAHVHNEWQLLLLLFLQWDWIVGNAMPLQMSTPRPWTYLRA